MHLNELALHHCQPFLDHPSRYRVSVLCSEAGSQIIDCGVLTPGSLEAGRLLAEICMAGLGQVSIVPYPDRAMAGPAVQVRTDQPIAACMASQYAGWQIVGEKFFAMGSGPMRAIRRKEPLFQDLNVTDTGYPAAQRSSELAPPNSGGQLVGVLETGKLPPAEVCQHVAVECGIPPENLTLLVARTASLAGSVQVVARSLETALHKLHELKFDLRRVVCGVGIAPLPPVAADDMVGIGRTNDAVLYGGDVTLWVTGDDASLREVGPRIPSSASRDYGAPFADIFARYKFDFYKIDPLLFSPARVTLINLDTGNSFRHGQLAFDVLERSFGMVGPDV